MHGVPSCALAFVCQLIWAWCPLGLGYTLGVPIGGLALLVCQIINMGVVLINGWVTQWVCLLVVWHYWFAK